MSWYQQFKGYSLGARVQAVLGWGISGGLFGCCILFPLLVIWFRLKSWITTGEMQHSNEVLNLEVGHVGKVFAELMAAFMYGVIFGFPLGIVIGLFGALIVLANALFKFAKDKI